MKHVTCSAEETHSTLTKTFPPFRTSCKKFILSFIATIRVDVANNSFGNKILNYCPYSITRAAAVAILFTSHASSKLAQRRNWQVRACHSLVLNFKRKKNQRNKIADFVDIVSFRSIHLPWILLTPLQKITFDCCK